MSPESVESAAAVLRRARVLDVRPEYGVAGLEILDGPLEGKVTTGLFYGQLGTAPEAGETVLANTTGLEMGLGTGGVAVVLPGGPAPEAAAPENANHFVKLPYTPLQFPVPPPAPGAEDLVGVPVVVLPLHSHLAPACCAAAILRPECRVHFVWQEGGALPVALSRSVRELKHKGLLGRVVSSGSSFGGDVEAPNVYAALLSAARGADLVLAGIGPGVVGTGAAYGHGGMSAAGALNAASALGAEPVLAPRVSSADPRERHQGLSHHTRSVLDASLGRCRVALPEALPDAARDVVGGLPGRHSYRPVSLRAAGSGRRFGVTFESMGRTYKDDPVFFDAAAAAVALALGEAR